MLTIRFARVRQNDIFFANKSFTHMSQFYTASIPNLKASQDDASITLSVGKMLEHLPSYDDRRKILAGDALASRWL